MDLEHRVGIERGYDCLAWSVPIEAGPVTSGASDDPPDSEDIVKEVPCVYNDIAVLMQLIEDVVDEVLRESSLDLVSRVGVVRVNGEILLQVGVDFALELEGERHLQVVSVFADNVSCKANVNVHSCSGYLNIVRYVLEDLVDEWN